MYVILFLYRTAKYFSQELPADPAYMNIPISPTMKSDSAISDPTNPITHKRRDARKIFHKQSLRSLEHDGMIEVFHLRSFPQLLIESEAGNFLIQTSALALRGIESQKVLVFEYTPYNYSASYLPIIETNSQVTNLIWDKRAVITYREELDISFWQQSTFLASINSVVYENYINWVGRYIQRQRVFVPQSVCSTSDISTCFTMSQTWDSFLRDRWAIVMLMSFFVLVLCAVSPVSPGLSVCCVKPAHTYCQ